MKAQDASSTPAINLKGDAAFRFLGCPTQLRATAESTNGAFGLIEHWEVPAGFASPYHTHRREDESFYILEGEVAFVLDGAWQRVGPGAFLFGPRDIPHGFKVVGTQPARMLLQATPGGFEQFVLELGQPLNAPVAPPDIPTMIATAARYGIDIHGPLPEEPETLASPTPLSCDPKDLNRRWITAFNERDWATERAVRSDDFRATVSGAPAPLDNAAWTGFLQGFVAAFPDSFIHVAVCIAEGDTVVSRWSITGTHQSEFQGIPATGRAVQLHGLELNHVRDGKIADHFAQFDLPGLMQQLTA
ncbi:cupin domain-containing protein [Acidobacteria bacterium AB60]|nr:cupin domain-containing protein [Acidobacteria bacterium AB60]